MTLEKCEQRLQDAARRMAAELNARFPAGCPVRVNIGRGREMLGAVACPTSDSPSCCTDVKIRSQSGHVHRRHFSEVRRPILRFMGGNVGVVAIG